MTATKGTTTKQVTRRQSQPGFPRGAAPRHRREGFLFRRDLRILLWLMVPAVVVLVVIDLAPVVIGVVNSFRLLSFSTLSDWVTAPWIGFRNYHLALTNGGGLSASALSATAHSLEYSLVTTALALVIGVVAAMTVAERASRATPVVRSLYLVPTALPLFTSAYLWRTILLPHTGLLDVSRRALGLGTDVNRVLVGDHSLAALVLVDLWFAWGFVYLFALAGLQKIPKELYEAAHIDGASRWQKFRYVTYPGLRRLLAVAAVLSTFGHYNDFTLPYVLFGQSPPSGVEVLPTTTYQAAYSIYNFGLADAIAVFGLVVIIIPVIVYVKYTFTTRSTLCGRTGRALPSCSTPPCGPLPGCSSSFPSSSPSATWCCCLCHRTSTSQPERSFQRTSHGATTSPCGRAPGLERA